MQIPIVRVAFHSEDEVADALPRQRQQRKLDQRPVQKPNASLARFGSEWKKPLRFSADRYDDSEPFWCVFLLQ
jgi:hypothetical protein